MEDGLLRFIGQLLVAHQLLDLALGALDVGLVREVGGEEHRLVADALERIGQRDLAALAVEVDAAGTDVLARALLQPRGELLHLLARPDLVGAVQAIHDVGHPARARLEVGDAQLREALEHALHHHARELDDLRDRMLERVRLGEAVEEVDAQARRGRAVQRDRHVEALGLLVERPERRIPQGLAHAKLGAVRAEHRADHAELGHGAAQLLHRLGHVLDRHQRDRLQPLRARLVELVGEPVVVGAC